MKYKLSIITPSFNQGRFILDNINSISNQSYPNIEHIIIDAKSSDNTIDILKKYDNIKWISEKDDGAANALNKGFKLASGQVISWLNCDDFYYDDVLKDVLEIFNNNEKIMLVYCNVDIVDIDKKMLYSRKTENFDLNYLIHKNADNVKQAGVFFRSDLLKQTGLLNESLKCAFDYDLFVRMLKITKPVYLDLIVAAQREYDQTLTRRFLKLQGKEIIKTSLKHGGKLYDRIIIYNLIKKVLKKSER